MLRSRFILLLAGCCSLGAAWLARDGRELWNWFTAAPVQWPQDQAGGGGGRENWRDTAIEHGWRLSYAEALTEARATNKPLMVVLRCIP